MRKQQDWKAVRESIRKLNETLDKVKELLTGQKNPSPLAGVVEDLENIFGR